MKKISRVICKILAFSCTFTLNLGIPSVKVAGMDIGALIEDQQVEQFLDEKKSDSIIEAMVDNDTLYLARKGYGKVYGFGAKFPFDSILKYECYKKDSTKQEIIDGKFNELLKFLESDSNNKECIYILANSTGLSLNVILCYLMILEPVRWSDEIKDLTAKFSKLSKTRLEDEDRKDKIDEIKSRALAFYFI